MPSEAITIPITDIRRHEINSVSIADVVNGVTSKPRHMPSLLLYDTQGLQHFTSITEAKDYYPTKSEVEILEKQAPEIIGSAAANSFFIELGAGDLSKTGILISALEAQKKPVVFFALDVDYKELQRSLHDLVTSIKPRFVEIRGLLGTYDDCATWLNQDASLTFTPITIIWLGSSIANLEISEARDLLSRFVGHSPSNRRMIVAADGCADEQKIRRAYDLVGGQSRLFVMNGLCHANRIIGSDQFRNTDWVFQGRYSTTERTFYSSVVAQRDVTLNVGGVHVKIGKGEEILMIKSAKWSADKLARTCKTARVRMSKTWSNAYGYGVYQLQADWQGDRKETTALELSLLEQT